MTLIKGKHVDKTTRIQSDSNPVGSDDLSRKLYIDDILSAKVSTSDLGVTVATLDESGKVPSSQLPGFVDDVVEFASLAGFPATGEAGKMYIALDTGKLYRWSGSVYVEIVGSPGSTDSIPEGTNNLYYTDERAALAAPVQSVAGKVGAVSLDKSDVGLDQVDNTSDLDKPISTATQTALDGKFDDPTGTSLDYIAGDGSILAFPTVMTSNKVVASVYNKTGAAIPAGSVVYINGVHGNKPTVALAQANSESNSSKVFGVVSAQIEDNALGTVVDFGSVIDIPTSTYAEGDLLWLSPTTPGAFTNSKPSAPNHMVFVGVVTRAHPIHGEISVKIQNGLELEELHNVAIAGLGDNQFLKYDLATLLWKNHSLTKSDIGLSDVDNTSDADKPISSAVSSALAGKADAGHTHTVADITDFEDSIPVKSVAGKTGDVSLAKGDVGLGEVDNTADIDKPVSAATSTALASKSDVGHGHSSSSISDFAAAAGAASPVQSVNSQVGDVVLTKSDVGLDQVDNTADIDKPVSSATQTALDGKQDSLGSGTESQFLAGDLTWKSIPTEVPYVAALSWSGSGPYEMIILAATHGKGADPIITVRELSGGDYYDKTVGYLGQELSVKVNVSGDVTLTYSSNFSGKVIIK
jgi:hypothetical protein